MDIYDVMAQLKAIELMEPEYTFLYDFFSRDAGLSEEDTAFFDVRKGQNILAPFVTEGVGGVLLPRSGYHTDKIEFCTIAPERIIDKPDITTRAFGEKILGAMTPEQRAKKKQAEDLVDMRKAIQRRREWMVNQVLLTGKLEVFRYTNAGRDKQTTKYADFGFTNYYTPDTQWGQVGAKVAYDMRKMAELVYDGLGDVDIVVMAPDVAEAMLADEAYMKTFDYKNAELGQIKARYRGQGMRYLGTNSDGTDMYAFSGKYKDDDGNVKPYIPAGKLIMGSRGMLKVLHGPVSEVDKPGPDGNWITYIKKEVPHRYANDTINAVMNRLTSRPIVMPENVDGWAVGSMK